MGFLLRNWHLKLSAVLLATVLYTGLVFSGSFTDSSVQVRVEQTNVSRDVFVLSAEPGVVDVSYRVSNEEAGGVTAADFVVAVDLSAYDLDRAPEPQDLPLEWRSLKDGVEILSVAPETVRVEADRVDSRSVPVEVDTGIIPEGLEIDDPVVNIDTVEVRGPAAVVSQVDRAVAFVDIPASGINVNEPAPLILVGIDDQPVGTGQLEVDPDVVSVQVEVRAVETETTVAVRPDIEGAPSPGFGLEAIRVEPAYVTIAGLPEVLAEVTSVTTEPISVDGLAADQTFEVNLRLPDDISLADGEPEAVTVTASIGPSVSSRTFVVGVVCSGATEDNACLPRLNEIAVTLSGAGNALSALTGADLTPTVDVAGLEPGNYDLQPVLSGLPEGVELVAISPGVIPVTIEAPEPTPTPEP